MSLIGIVGPKHRYCRVSQGMVPTSCLGGIPHKTVHPAFGRNICAQGLIMEAGLIVIDTGGMSSPPQRQPENNNSTKIL